MSETKNEEPGVDLPRIERAVREILEAVGEDPDREGLLETPARVARMYAEMFAGLHADPGRHLAKVFTEEYDEIVLVRDISFCSMCEHHLLPFTGQAHIAYLPHGKVVGLSKLARVVEEVARRPQVQERQVPRPLRPRVELRYGCVDRFANAALDCHGVASRDDVPGAFPKDLSGQHGSGCRAVAR